MPKVKLNKIVLNQLLVFLLLFGFLLIWGGYEKSASFCKICRPNRFAETKL